MAIELGGLAARLKAGIEAAAAAREAEVDAAAREAAEREAASASAAAARVDMMAALKSLAKGVGHFKVKTMKGSLHVSFNGRDLQFVPDGEGDRIRIAAKGHGVLRHYLTRDSVGDWEVVLAGDEPRRLPVEYGLEELIGMYLAVTVDAPAPAHRSVAEEPVPVAKPSKPAASVEVKEMEPARSRSKSRVPKTSPGSGLKEHKGPFG